MCKWKSLFLHSFHFLKLRIYITIKILMEFTVLLFICNHIALTALIISAIHKRFSYTKYFSHIKKLYNFVNIKKNPR